MIEAKWHDSAASNEPVYQFVGKVEGRMYGRGTFVSVQGFSENVVRSIVVGKAIKTIFVDNYSSVEARSLDRCTHPVSLSRDYNATSKIA